MNRLISIIIVGAFVVLSTSSMSAQTSAVAYDYSSMYEEINPSIAKIFADSRTGSGFLIDSEGLVATNHHVVANARYLAVQFANGMKHRAVVAAMDPKNDVAILKVHEAVAKNLNPLPLRSDTAVPPLKPGLPVVAFGSPLSQTFLVTQGIISKVEDTVVLGDFLIEQGNSGGPLLNLAGEVVGINTFGIGGLAGAVRVEFLDQLLSTTRGLDIDSPSLEALPMMQTARYPTELLKRKVLQDPIDDDSYEMDGGQFDITALTPVSIARAHIGIDLQRAYNRIERRGAELEDEALWTVDGLFYDWERKASRWLDYVVRFEVKPEFGSTTGSTWASIATAALTGFTAGFTGEPQFWLPPHQNIEFKGEFLDFQVYRNGEFVAPITPGREVTETAFRNYNMTFIDEAYSGMYAYSPDVFMEGESYTFHVYAAKDPLEAHKTITLSSRSEFIRQLRNDFAGADPGHSRTWRLQHINDEAVHCAGEFRVTGDGVSFIADEGEHGFEADWFQVGLVRVLDDEILRLQLTNGRTFDFQLGLDQRTDGELITLLSSLITVEKRDFGSSRELRRHRR